MATDADILAIAIPQIQGDEGCRLESYPDPLTGADPWTIGWGCTGPGISKNTVWTKDQADAALIARASAIPEAIDSHLNWWRILNAPRAAVLVNMAFNMGIGGLMGFHSMLAACKAADWDEAANDMLASKWARQVPNRAHRLAQQMQTGITV